MTVKTAISIPDDVFERMEAAAREQGMSRSGFILAALEKYFFDRETERLIAAWTAAVNDMSPEEIEEDLAWADWSHQELERLAEKEGDVWEPARDLAG